MEDATHEFDNLKARQRELEKENYKLKGLQQKAENEKDAFERDYEKYRKLYTELQKAVDE